MNLPYVSAKCGSGKGGKWSQELRPYRFERGIQAVSSESLMEKKTNEGMKRKKKTKFGKVGGGQLINLRFQWVNDEVFRVYDGRSAEEALVD